MRIVVSVTGTRGDIAPMLALGGEMVRRGHEVVVTAPPGFAADAVLAGVAYRPVGPEPSSSLRAWGEPGERVGPIATYRRQLAHHRAEVDAQFSALQELVADADLVIGAGLPLAARSLAEANGKAYRFVHYCPQALPSAQHPPVGMAWLGPPAVNRTLWAANHLVGAMLSPVVDPHRSRLGLPKLADPYAHALGRDLRPVVAADRPLAPVPEDVRIDAVQTAAIVPLDRGELSAAGRAALAGQPPVFVGFGSMVSERTGRLAEEVLAALSAVGRRALVAPGLFADGLQRDDITLLAPYEPHGAIFPNVAAIVHHGGAGTTTAAARAGIPQVIVTHGWDQEYWGRRVAALGIGAPPLHVERLRPGALAEALRFALAEDVRRRAREVSRALAGHDGVSLTADALLDA